MYQGVPLTKQDIGRGEDKNKALKEGGYEPFWRGKNAHERRKEKKNLGPGGEGKQGETAARSGSSDNQCEGARKTVNQGFRNEVAVYAFGK